jgi:type 1 glutamine amidotransferase
MCRTYFRARAVVLAVVLFLLATLASSCVGPFARRPKGPIKAVVVTGGHAFEHDPFFAVFDEMEDVEYTEFVLKDQSEIFEDISDWDYDVIVLYSMTQKISEKRRENLVKLLDDGVGFFAMHHNMCSFQEWPEYREIIGTRYYTQAVGDQPKCTYLHDIDFKVAIADKKHPITRGMSDFEIHDETYKNCAFEADNHVLLTTDHPTSDKTIMWTRKYGKARVCTIQLGHDSKAYENPNYRMLLDRAVRWCAGRL